VHPDYAKIFKASDIVPRMRAYRQLVMTGKSDTTALNTNGAALVDDMWTLQGMMVDQLDILLEARLQGLQDARNTTVALVAVFLFLAIYLFYSFYLVTQGGLSEVRRHLVAMTGGDLTTSPNPWGKDEAAELMFSLRDMQTSLRTIVSQVRQSSENLVQASSEIASASLDLSSRTEQAAASLEESASSMEEIASTVRHTSDNVHEVAKVATINAGSAQRGGAVIENVVATMDEINRSSKQISEIIGTIDGIAFQTNILALNAAVEAARAGEQGRGFAVVATEVRSLALRTAQAAREISALILASVKNVDSGSQVVRGAGETMRELVDNAGRMNTLLTEISTTSREQSKGVAQIGTGIHELDRMTQQNAALVEETAASAALLRDSALELAERVAKFTLPA
jgi:methyl-accepting chemotaxis protein